ncbi:Hydrogen peroxide-inducible genes activator [Candidatus Terasakiella magnetica]|uniref:Hydrogen peroxide-inducible genes activator n=1 Tax=Candidatus Terasakiella magnetica TaxID=1867952 RepID=A0A1C3RGY8_9PROT|nr:hydrogen peroxide-inducible genes activator [Candidatus Terasakiella magnetica]SCA56567.1 Hydrogen peroxide-inducible genes activator [Candidatus Terasakiella magnetica]
MLTLRQLEYIISVDEERHFRKAAERVHVSQPSLSAQIMQLEQRMGVTIFTRSKKGVFPTPVGQELIARARKILSDVDGFKEFAERSSHPLSGRIRFGTPPTIGPYLLPHIVPKLHQKFPDLKFIVKEEMPKNIQASVENGSLDIALTPLPLLSNNLQSQIIFTERLYVGMAWDHMLSTHCYLKGSDIKGQEVLTLTQGHHLHDQVKSICDTYGAEILYDYEGGSLDALRHMVAMGAGISFFPELYVLSEIKGRTDLCTKEITDNNINRDIAMVWRKDNPLSEEFIKFSDLFKVQVEGLFT